MTQTPTKTVHVLGVPMDLGQKRRGVDMGPSAVRYAGLQNRLLRLGFDVQDDGNIIVPVMEEIEDSPTRKMHHGTAIGAVCRAVHQRALETACENCVSIFLGGDHSMSLGSISAQLERTDRLGVLWVDAHGDLNTPATTPSGNVHGMVVAALMGLCPPELTIGTRRLKPEQIVYIGARDLDPGERALLREHKIKVFTMRELDVMGMARVAQEALGSLDADSLHISWDMDSLDPQVISGVGTPVPGGLTYREAHLLAELLSDDGRVRSFDLVEINPILDRENRTARVAVEIAASLLGQRIL